MKNLPSEERRLTLEGFRIKFYYNQTFQFVLSPKEKSEIIIKKIGEKTWKEVQNTVEIINKCLSSQKNLEIHEENLLVPPNDQVWRWVWASAVFILIAFVLEILSAYYVDNSDLAYIGLGIFFLGFSILVYLVIQQQFFSSFEIEEYMSKKDYCDILTPCVLGCFSSNSYLFDNESFRCEYKKPFLVEFCVY
jgi:hypothetical protein